MSFDVFLVAFQEGEKTIADASAARAVLNRFRYDRLSESAYNIAFEDGSHVELSASGLAGDEGTFDSAMVVMRGLSEAIGAFLFEFSRAAGLVLFPAMKPSCVLLPRDDLAEHLPPGITDDFPSITIANGPELIAALNGGFDAWKAYRDQVLSKSGDPPQPA